MRGSKTTVCREYTIGLALTGEETPKHYPISHAAPYSELVVIVWEKTQIHIRPARHE